jgi:hypothetical protein
VQSPRRRNENPHAPQVHKRCGVRAAVRSCALPGLAAVTALLACALLAACGGSSPNRSAASSEQAREREAETRNADFARCLREHGIHAETVSGPNGGHGLKVGGGNSGPQAMEEAQKACARYRPEPKTVDLSPQQKVEREEAVQKFARCMREHGIKVEASAKGGAIQIGIHGGAASGGLNPNSPSFQLAQTTCQKLLPKPPGGGAGPERSAPSTDSGKSGEGSSSGLALSGG